MGRTLRPAGITPCTASSRGRLRVAVVARPSISCRACWAALRPVPDIEIALEVLNRDGVVQRLRENLDDLCHVHAPADLDPEDHVFLQPADARHLAGPSPGRRRRIVPGGPGQRAFRAAGKRGSGTRLATDRFFAAQGFEAPTRL